MKITVYARFDARDVLIGLDSETNPGLDFTQDGWEAIDQGEGDLYALAQTHYLPEGLTVMTDRGSIYRYKRAAGRIVPRTQAEIDADAQAMPTPPAPLETRVVRMLAENGVLGDAQLEEVPEAFRAWSAGSREHPQAYGAKEVVRHGGMLYRCAQAHAHHGEAGWAPGEAPALWTALGVSAQDPGAVPEWVQPAGAHDAYEKGAVVRYQDAVWVSVFDGPNTWAPGVYGWDVHRP